MSLLEETHQEADIESLELSNSIVDEQKAETEPSVAQDIILPAKVFDLLVTGKIPLRGVQIYLSMLKDAEFKIGGVATLSYNEISANTTIQTPRYTLHAFLLDPADRMLSAGEVNQRLARLFQGNLWSDDAIPS